MVHLVTMELVRELGGEGCWGWVVGGGDCSIDIANSGKLTHGVHSLRFTHPTPLLPDTTFCDFDLISTSGWPPNS